jgi:alpha-N-arabinofuranosidase
MNQFRRIIALLAMLWTGCFTAATSAQTTAPAQVSYTVHADRTTSTISEGIYGQFLEHIYNSVHGGLWGDQILNGTLELRPPRANRSGTTQPLNLTAAPLFWELAADGAQVRSDTNDSFNGQTSIHISRDAAGALAGVRQKDIALKSGERYRTTLYVRGKGTLQFQLADDSGEIFSRAIPAGDAWQKTSFEFTPSRAAGTATLTIGLADSGDVHVDQVSMFSAAALATGGYRPDLLKAIADLKPASIRWPGGSFANSYIWQNGIGPAEKRVPHPVEIWNDRDPNQFGTDEFMQFCKLVGADPVIVINTARGVEDALHWLEYCMGDATTTWGKVRAANGHPEPYILKVIEIDNEAWLLMNQARYIEIVKEFVPAIRAKFPNLKISICGSYGFDDGTGEGRAEWKNAGWDQAMLDNVAQLTDILSPHYYNGLLATDAPDYVNNPRVYEAHLKDLAARIRQSPNPGIKVYMSEWNLTHGRWGNDWRVGLYAGGILNAFERQSDLVVMTCPALFMRRTWASAWNNALINFDQNGWFPAGNYVVMKLFRESFAPQLLAVDGPEKPLNLTATRSQDGNTVYLKLVNPEQMPVNADFALDGSFTPSQASMQLIAPGGETVKNTMDHPDQIKPVPAEVTRSGQRITVALPPLSVGVVKLTR